MEKNYFPESCSLSPASANYNSTANESSITVHLQHCFKDTSQSSPPIKDNSANPSSAKPSRPFLKKGAGLKRYMPKSATSKHAVKNTVLTKSERNPHRPQKFLKLKPTTGNSDILPEQVKHIRFAVPEDENMADNDSTNDINLPKSALSACGNSNTNEEEMSYSSNSSSTQENDICKDNILDLSIPDNGSLNLSKENRELEEFELLENCAQNSSFNSDCSLVRKILNVEPTKPLHNDQKGPVATSSSNVNGISGNENCDVSSVRSIFSPKIGLSKYLKQARRELSAKQLNIEPVISDIHTRIQSFQKVIFNSRQDDSSDISDLSERCSTPIDNLSLENRNLQLAPEDDPIEGSFDPQTSILSENTDIETCDSDCQDCNDPSSNQNSLEEEDLLSEIPDFLQQNNQVSCQKCVFLERLEEREKKLKKEIEIYQQQNQMLEVTAKQRDELLKHLTKEREDFKTYKEAEKKKLQAEIEEKHRQLQRERETFTRLQKLSKDNPTRKDREELHSLRQEVEKLQEDLKRQKIKHTNETRKLKSQLDVAEKDRDILKLENIRLEEQIEDLFAASKGRVKKSPEIASKQIQTDEIDTLARNKQDMVIEKSLYEDKVTDSQVQEKKLESCLSETSSKNRAEKKSKSKVCFNFHNECRNIQEKHIEIISEKSLNLSEETDSRPNPCEEKAYYPHPSEDKNYHQSLAEEEDCHPSLSEEKDSNPDVNENLDHDKIVTIVEKNETPSINAPAISVSTPMDSKEIDHGYNLPLPGQIQLSTVNLSTISVSAEFETREFVYDKRVEKYFSNGDRQITFQTGTRKIISADGKTTKFFFTSGDTKEILPDKREVYKFVDGKTRTRFPDGLEVIEMPNGEIQRRYPDGRKEAEFPNGIIVKRFADRSSQVCTPDGMVVNVSADGTETVEYLNEQKEILASS